MAAYVAPPHVYGQYPAGSFDYLAAPQQAPHFGEQPNPGRVLQPEVSYERLYVEAPVPRVPGGRELAYVPPMERNITPGPCGHLDVGMAQKQWYNTRIYVPEYPRGGEYPAFLERFDRAHMLNAQGDSGTYVDNWRAQARIDFYQKKVADERRMVQERHDVRAGVGIRGDATWSDAYSGEKLVEHLGNLKHGKEFIDQYGVRKSDWDQFTNYLFQGWDYGNLRCPWPFEDTATGRNKVVTKSAFEFERQHPLYTGDRRFEIREAGSAYYAPNHA